MGTEDLLSSLEGSVQLLDESQRYGADRLIFRPIAEWLRYGPNRDDHDAVDDGSERTVDEVQELEIDINVDSDDANFGEPRSDGECRLEDVDSDEFQTQEAGLQELEDVVGGLNFVEFRSDVIPDDIGVEEVSSDEFHPQEAEVPEEILEHIFDYIGIRDIASMRSVCKSWHWFITRMIFGKLIGKPASEFRIVHEGVLFSRHCEDVRDLLSSEISQGQPILVRSGDEADCFVMLVLDEDQLKELIQNSVPDREVRKFWSVNGKKIHVGILLLPAPCFVSFMFSVGCGIVLSSFLPKPSPMFVLAVIFVPFIPASCCSVLCYIFGYDCVGMYANECSKESVSQLRKTTVLRDICFWIRHATCRALKLFFKRCCRCCKK